jgi:uncharacterized repeat protein (TIGR01451 family)
MKVIYALGGVAVFGLGIAGWAMIARGQSGLSRPASDPGTLPPSILLPSRAEMDQPPQNPVPPPSPRLNNVVITNVNSSPAPAPAPPSAPAALPPRIITATPPRTQTAVERSEPTARIVNENPIPSRQESVVAVEWRGPATLTLNKPADYTLIVRNTMPTTVNGVRVTVPIPTGLAVASAKPEAATEERKLLWDLGVLQPRQERNLRLRLVPETTGELAPYATVTYTYTSPLRLQVRSPRLVLKTKAPSQVALGDPANIVFTVTNTGDGEAERVKIQANLSDGLEHASGRNVELQIGAIAPGETRSATLACSPKKGGQHRCEACAVSDGGITARDQVMLTATAPRLVIQTAGPGIRYLDRRALYTVRILNPGDAPAANVVLTDSLPAGMKFLSASDGGQVDSKSNTVSWRLGDIGPGKTKEVRLEAAPTAIGEHHQHLVVQGAHGQKAEADVKTRAEGVASLVTEVVDTEDPIEVGAETTYEVRIVNTGSKDDGSVQLVCIVPEKMELRNAQGPSKYRAEGKKLIFEPLVRLAPRGDALYRITTRGMAPGDVRFQIQITSTNLTEPIVRTESTRIYSDTQQ